MRPLGVWSFVGLALLAGCDGAKTPAITGEPCTATVAHCAGGDIVECRAGKWQQESCDERCAALHGRASTGCRALIDAAAECECAVAPACSAPPFCESSGVESFCENGVSHERSCYEHCSDAGAGSLPTGCFLDVGTGRGSCACATAGTACAPDRVGPCAGPSTLSTCSAGVWHTVDCAAQCRGNAICNHDSNTDQGRCICRPGASAP